MCGPLRRSWRTFPSSTSLGEGDLYAVVQSLGDVTGILHRAEPQELADLYAALRLEMTYHHDQRAVDLYVSQGDYG